MTTQNPKYLNARRFSKPLLLDVISKKVTALASQHRFDRSDGTAQLMPKGASEPECSRILRAVEYGRMKALEELADSISDGFRFDE